MALTLIVDADGAVGSDILTASTLKTFDGPLAALTGITGLRQV